MSEVQDGPRRAAVALALAALTLVVFWRVGGYPFTALDDGFYIYENPAVKAGLSVRGIVSSFTMMHTGHWHPVTWLSHMLDVDLFGLDPGWHHRVNLLIHLFNVLFLFHLLQRMTGALWRSAIVAGLFAVHPLHVESVAWISERKDLLCAAFSLAAIDSYRRYVGKRTPGRYLAVVLLFVLALMSKPMAVTLPFLLLLLDAWPLQRFRWAFPGDGRVDSGGEPASRLIREKAPLLLLSTLSCLVTLFAAQRAQALSMLDAISFGERLVNAVVSYVTYLQKTAWPAGLTIFYPHPSDTGGLAAWKVLGALAVLATLSVAALRRIKDKPVLAVGWLWYVVTLLPVIGLVQVGGQAMADRYTYFPLIGIFILATWGLYDFAATYSRSAVFTPTAATLSVAVLLVLGAASWKQLSYWRDDTVLFGHALETTTGNWQAHNVMGLALARAGRIDEAIPHYLEALRIKPYFLRARNNLGGALMRAGRTGEAIVQFQEILRYDPDFENVHFYMANIYKQQGRLEEAHREYVEAIRRNPAFSDGRCNFGTLLAREGRFDEAAAQFREAIRLDPANVFAYTNLANVLIVQGKHAEALGMARTAARLDPSDPLSNRLVEQLSGSSP